MHGKNLSRRKFRNSKETFYKTFFSPMSFYNLNLWSNWLQVTLLKTVKRNSVWSPTKKKVNILIKKPEKNMKIWWFSSRKTSFNLVPNSLTVNMSFRTLRFGDRTISYDAGLNLAESEGKIWNPQNFKVPTKVGSNRWFASYSTQNRDKCTHLRYRHFFQISQIIKFVYICSSNPGVYSI